MIDGKHRWRAGDERVTCKGSAELERGNIVPGVFALVLALKLVPAIKPHYLTDIPTAGKPDRFASILLVPKMSVQTVCLEFWGWIGMECCSRLPWIDHTHSHMLKVRYVPGRNGQTMH